MAQTQTNDPCNVLHRPVLIYLNALTVKLSDPAQLCIALMLLLLMGFGKARHHSEQ